MKINESNKDSFLSIIGQLFIASSSQSDLDFNKLFDELIFDDKTLEWENIVNKR